MSWESGLANIAYCFDAAGLPILRKFDPAQLPSGLPPTTKICGSQSIPGTSLVNGNVIFQSDFCVKDNQTGQGGWNGPGSSEG
jgi:hypothetical protein